MAYLTIHPMEGNPDELLHRKQERFDPIVGKPAGAYRALFSVTAPTVHGLVVINVWESPEGAAAFRQLPPIQEAQRASVLPSPRFFERFTDAQLKEYPRGTRPAN